MTARAKDRYPPLVCLIIIVVLAAFAWLFVSTVGSMIFVGLLTGLGALRSMLP